MQKETFSEASLKELTEHVVAKHHSFLRRQLPQIAELFQAARKARPELPKTLSEAQTIFSSVRTKIEAHLRDEEQFLFPIGICLSSGGTPDACELDLKTRLEEMEKEHDNAGVALAKCRLLLSDFNEPDINNIVTALNSLIDDLDEHVRVENTFIHPLLRKYLNQAVQSAASSISDSKLLDHIKILSSDHFQGRAPGSH